MDLGRCLLELESTGSTHAIDDNNKRTDIILISTSPTSHTRNDNVVSG